MRLFIAIVTLGALAACSDSTSPTAMLRGTYALTAVNATPVPATLQQSGFTYTYTSGTLTVGDTSYTYSLIEKMPPGSGIISSCGTDCQVLTSAGSVRAQSDGAFTFTDYEVQKANSVTLNGSTLTMQQPAGTAGLTFTFARR